MQILATFNASTDVLSTHGVFKGSICQETGITTAAPGDRTGMVQIPKILDC